MNRRRLAAAAATVLLVLPMFGCAKVSSSTKTYYEPVHVETPKATTEPKVVKFTEESAARAGVQTAAVKQEGASLLVPSSSLIYEKSGSVMVFAQSEPLTYHRVLVELVRDDGTNALLAKGPTAGTLVVTTGANQVWGAEQGIGH